MYDESLSEESEVTMVYRKSKTKHKRRTRRKRTSANVSTSDISPRYSLSPYIVGPKPPKVDNITKDREGRQTRNTNSERKTIFTDTFESTDGRIYLNSDKHNLLKPNKNRVFLGECPLYDEEEIAVLKSTQVWKLRKTGQKGLDKFRHTVEFLRFARKLCKSEESSHLSQNETILFFLDTQPTDEDVTSKLLFDITPFKSQGQRTLVSSVKNVLEVHPENRSENEVNSILHLLRGFSKFSNYPHSVQKGLCRRGWYSRFDKSKILTREGSRAEFYYLILTGVAVSRCLNDTSDDRRRQVAGFHRQGDTLGEKEILTDTERPATVVCKEPLEVLAVDREVLLDIFKSAGGLDCIDFLRSIPELSDFPLELLQSYHFSCSIHPYRRGAVIVKNSNEAEWIYVVKSGSCQVYRIIDEHAEKKNICDECKLQRTTTSFVLPKLKTKGGLHSRSSENVSSKSKSQDNKAKKKRDAQHVNLPPIPHAKNALIAMETPETNEPPSKKESKQKALEKEKSVEEKQYAKVDIITQNECFGLESLIYDEVPQMSLVSNGAECILISKQFLRDHLDRETRQKLRAKIPPYPDLSRLQEAVDDKRAWEAYRREVLKDYLR